MTLSAVLNRRAALAAGVAAGVPGVALAAPPAGPAAAGPEALSRMDGLMVPSRAFGLDPAATGDQTARLQAAIDHAAARSMVLALAPGRYVVGGVVLRPGTRIQGVAGASVLAFNGKGVLAAGSKADGLRLEGLVFDGGGLAVDAARGGALLSIAASAGVGLADLVVRHVAGHGIKLTGVSGRVTASTITAVNGAAIFSLDAVGLEIAHNTIADAQDNGILVWRSAHGVDGTLVMANRIERVGAASGGTGQYGNGINVYRAGGVVVSGNRIVQCAFTAVRANEASNVQMLGNSVERMGEVALYAEAADERAGAAGFEGAMIANNLVDTAATGIAVTNFNNGARLAVIQGNIVRNLFRREGDPRDQRGEGIGVEADAIVANNVIENAPTVGLLIGWGKYMREVIATGNLIRRARIGIAVTGDAGAGQCLIASNMITGSSDGAIRAMDHARPLSGDLAQGSKAPRHLTLSGNIAV